MFHELDFEMPRLTRDAKMELAIEIARRNVAHDGGPFGAVVFERETGVVIAPGANFVVGQRSSLLHAEVVAMAMAQARLQTYTLSGKSYELVTSSEPCVQCFGAIFWCGIDRLICGAPLEAATAAGFDEGPRGIAVEDRVLEESACKVLSDYVRRGGIVYNARSSMERSG
jgi:tRNA(Arg) A34 adenosine deaminase TadA